VSFGPPSRGEKSTRSGETGLDFTRLAAIDVGRHFGRRKALAHVSFECQASEIVGLLGPNGAGKSTLLSILATLLAPSTGRVEYGTATADQAGAALRARLGMLGHDLYLYPELTARENLLFFARLYGVSDAARVVAEGLEHAALTSRADDQVSGFSRGMRQRLALERALLHRPRLLLLDEPFTGLDQASSTALAARLRGLREQGCLIILATHDLEVAEHVVSRSLFLRHGRLAEDSSATHDLRSRYLRVMGQT
jgi:heme exporter protein A